MVVTGYLFSLDVNPTEQWVYFIGGFSPKKQVFINCLLQIVTQHIGSLARLEDMGSIWLLLIWCLL